MLLVRNQINGILSCQFCKWLRSTASLSVGYVNIADRRHHMLFPDIMEPSKEKQLGWFGLLMIAVLSGLIVKVVGDPIAQVMGPKVEDVAEEATDFLHDQHWEKQLNRWIKDWFSQDRSST